MPLSQRCFPLRPSLPPSRRAVGKAPLGKPPADTPRCHRRRHCSGWNRGAAGASALATGTGDRDPLRAPRCGSSISDPAPGPALCTAPARHRVREHPAGGLLRAPGVQTLPAAAAGASSPPLGPTARKPCDQRPWGSMTTRFSGYQTHPPPDVPSFGSRFNISFTKSLSTDSAAGSPVWAGRTPRLALRVVLVQTRARALAASGPPAGSAGSSR